jgi:hypothetical protein
VNNNDERDYAEEAANEALLREREDLDDYTIDSPATRPALGADTPAVPHRDDADLVADAMKTLEDQLLAMVPADQRNTAQDLVSSLLDLAPGQALGLADTHDLARAVLAPRRTLEDWAINTYARFYPHREAASEDDYTSHPCVALGGDEEDDGAVQAYVYAEDGGVVISLHYDTAGPDETGRGPWAYYGKDDAVPTRVLGGDGQPVYVAAAGVPDLSDELTEHAHSRIRQAHAALAGEGQSAEEWSYLAEELASVLQDFLAITGRPYTPDSGAEGGL